jgi:hypothetical protein
MNDKERYMRWETKWDLHRGITREEKRKEEVLKVFEGLGDLSKCRVEAPFFRPGSPLGGKRGTLLPPVGALSRFGCMLAVTAEVALPEVR